MDKQSTPFRQAPPDGVLSLSALSSPNGEVSRLMAAAVVDRQFRELLLENPAVAVESGYGDESFDLTPEENDLVSSVQQATSLADFAMGLVNNYSEAERQSKNSP